MGAACVLITRTRRFHGWPGRARGPSFACVLTLLHLSGPCLRTDNIAPTGHASIRTCSCLPRSVRRVLGNPSGSGLLVMRDSAQRRKPPRRCLRHGRDIFDDGGRGLDSGYNLQPSTSRTVRHRGRPAWGFISVLGVVRRRDVDVQRLARARRRHQFLVVDTAKQHQAAAPACRTADRGQTVDQAFATHGRFGFVGGLRKLVTRRVRAADTDMTRAPFGMRLLREDLCTRSTTSRCRCDNPRDTCARVHQSQRGGLAARSPRMLFR